MQPVILQKKFPPGGANRIRSIIHMRHFFYNLVWVGRVATAQSSCSRLPCKSGRGISEIGSEWVLGLFDPALNHEFFVVAVTGVEIVAAITRRARGGSISATDATAVRSQVRGDLQTDYHLRARTLHSQRVSFTKILS